MADSSLRIFVVDDEPIIAATITTILQQSGFIAVPFTDPAAALRAAKAQAPGLILSDVFMNGMTGIELAVAVQRLCPDCRVILISGQPESEEILRASEHGFNFKLLTKPTHPRDLLQHVEHMLRKGPRLMA